MLCYVILCHFVSFSVILCHLMSSYAILCHLMSSHVILCHLISPYMGLNWVQKKQFVSFLRLTHLKLTHCTLHRVKWFIFLMLYELIYLEPTTWFLAAMSSSRSDVVTLFAPGSAHARLSAQPPIDVSGNFLTKSCNFKHFCFFLKKKLFFWGGGTFFLIKFLAKSNNSKHFCFFFHFFPKKIKIVLIMFALHLQKQWLLFLPAISINQYFS